MLVPTPADELKTFHPIKHELLDLQGCRDFLELPISKSDPKTPLC